MENLEVSSVLGELGDLLEIQGSNPFRIRAYRNAVRTISGLTQSLASMLEAGDDLTELPGIGKDIAKYIAELVETGKLARLKEIGEEVPRSLIELVKLDGVGPKKVQKLWLELGVTSIDELVAAIEAGRVAGLEGFGETTVAKISRAIEDYRKRAGRFRLDQVEALVRPLVAHMVEAPGVVRVEVAGSYRRRKETVGDIDLLIQAEEGWPAIMDHFTGFNSVERVVSAGETRGSVVLRSGLEVDLRILPERSMGAALHYFTGSKEHSVAIRQLAQRQGLRVNEWGVFRVPEGDGDGGDEAGERIAGTTEEDVFGALGLEWIPPVLRENRGEVAAAQNGELPRLLELGDIRGDIHMHSTWSDGKQSLREMALACQERGYEYMAITDHSPVLAMVQGLTPEKALRQWDEIEEVRAEFPDFGIFRGMEVDILRDGSLDMTDEVLAGLDLVLISVHSLMDMEGPTMTDRVLRAMQHPAVDIVAHPTGRVLGRREPFALDLEAVLRAAADLDLAVELNANPHRLDLKDIHVHRARELGVKVAISTDAHSTMRLDHMEYGVDMARRGWLEKENVLNTLPIDEFRAWLRRREMGI